MIPVSFHTNLDLFHSERWPDKLPCRPMIGDYVRSLRVWNPLGSGITGYRLELQVVGVELEENLVLCELHLPKGRFENILKFEEWYKKIRGCA